MATTKKKKKTLNKGGGPKAGPSRTQPNPNPPKKGETRNPVPKGKPRQPDGSPNSQGVSVEKYNEMAAAYFDVQSVNHVRTTCNVSFPTAKKYIERGDPKRGLKPIRSRFLKMQSELEKKQERTWEQAQTEWKSLIRANKALISQAFQKLSKDPNQAKAFIAGLLARPKDLSDVMSKLLRDESFVFGGPDGRLETSNVTNSLSQATTEELLEYLESGKRPDRLLGVLKSKDMG